MPPFPPHPVLVAFLVLIVTQRLSELWISSRHARALARIGGVRYHDPQFPYLVALHVLYPVTLATEVLVLGARPGAAWPLWLGLLLGAQALRFAAMRALGERWNVRIWIVPGTRPIRRGPYRFVRHPNYVAVAVELIAGPLLFGAWRTALLVSIVNAALLAGRIRLENEALRRAALSAAAPESR